MKKSVVIPQTKKTKRARHCLFDDSGIIDACLLVIDDSIRVCCNDFVTNTHTHIHMHIHTYTHTHTHTHTHTSTETSILAQGIFHNTWYAWGHKAWHVAEPR